jgi:hypothetical protein
MLWITSRLSLYSSDEFVPCVGKYALMMHIINISAHVPVTVTTAIQLPTIPKNIRPHKLVKQKLVWDQIDNEKYNENITANLKDIDDFQNNVES